LTYPSEIPEYKTEKIRKEKSYHENRSNRLQDDINKWKRAVGNKNIQDDINGRESWKQEYKRLVGNISYQDI